MEQKLVRVPFDIELAKEITNDKIEGKIVTRDGRNVRIVCFDARMDDNIVALIENEEGVEYATTFNSLGQYFIEEERPYDLFLEIPEYLTFKDGDVIAFENMKDNPTIGIFQKRINSNSHRCYVKIDYLGYVVYDAEPLNYNNARFATESEKQRLIDALKESTDERAKDCLKMLGIENSPKLSNSSKIGKNEFEFRQLVLVRDSKNDLWTPAEFGFKDKDDSYYVIGGIEWKYCIPYEGNEHLLGTTNDYKEE